MTMRETQHTEWKESWRDEFLKWISGFANAEGGTLVIGRNDAGHVVGVADAARLLEEIPNKVRDVLGIMVDVNLRQESGKDFLEIVVEPYPYPVSYKGAYHYRSGSTKQELKGAALDRFLLAKQGRHWDGVPVPGFGISDLSPEALNRFRALAGQGNRVADGLLTAPDGELIDKLHLREGTLLKRAAILLFGRDPERLITGAFLKIGFFHTDSDLRYHDEIHGDLFTQVERGLDLLLTKYLKSEISYWRAQRIERLPVPDNALREALINAIAHKDYAAAAPIQVSVYPDKLMIWNPGHLPEGWTLDHLLAKHASHPFNPEIANTFFHASLLESWGRGFDLIRRACRAHDSPEPTLRWDNGLWVEFRFPVGATPPVTPPVAPPVAPSVSEPLAALVRLIGNGTFGAQAIREGLGLKDRAHVRDAYVNPAIAAGIIELTVPDKPKSRLQQYRLTTLGRQALAAMDQPPRPNNT
jgi:ATP-dependent DNA helicase RecG